MESTAGPLRESAFPADDKPMPSLSLMMTSLDELDRTGPLSSIESSTISPFLQSPLVASALLLSAHRIAKGAVPPLFSPTSPIVMHPIALPVKAAQPTEGTSNIEIFDGQVRPVAVAAYQDLLLLARTAKWKVAYQSGEPFSRNEQLPYFERVRLREVGDTIEKIISEIWSADAKEAIRARELAAIVIDPKTPVGELVGALQKAFELFLKAIQRMGGASFSSFGESVHPSQTSPFVMTVQHSPERMVIEWSSSLGQDLLSAVMNRAQHLRDDEVDPSFVDYIVFHIGYEMLKSGARLDSSDARWLGTPGFRKDTQTYVSLTDPGEGHVYGTTRKEKWLRGAICHVEHLERPGNLAREEIESYRIPSIFEFARVRLHTGNAAPNTYFVGRRVKDSTSGDFALDFIKVVNLTSAACSAAFQLGAAETKVAMDGLTASEQVRYMRGLAGHVLRNHKQILSAAYNLNSPLIDDLAKPNADGSVRVLTGNMEIGQRGIELAAMGGFDKVTFDGAADTYPSYCVILQLTFQNALDLVHRAHSAGLLTYMSAGFKFNHIADAVYSGVDGIGIGGAQILRYMDGNTGHHGPYTEEYIDQIDLERDTAAQSVRGRGAHLLCRLDRMHHEGSITVDEESLREPLYQALHELNEPAIATFLSHKILEPIVSMSDDGETPCIATARRILRASEQSLLRVHAVETPQSAKTWQRFVRDLRGLLPKGDEAILAQYFRSQPWSSLREAHHSRNATPTAGDRLYTIKTPPHAPALAV